MNGNTRIVPWQTPVLERFIVFEGIDGSGTTTQAAQLADNLTKLGLVTWLTAEPTPHAVGRLIRQILSSRQPVLPDTLAMLFAADRREHLYGVGGIVEHLQAGEWVICDRYVFSSIVYQSLASSPEFVWSLNRDFPSPALVCYIDVDPETADVRLQQRTNRDVFERIDLQRRVYRSYNETLARFADNGPPIVQLSGHEPISTVAQKVFQSIRRLLPPTT